jgi:hypothetical protein
LGKSPEFVLEKWPPRARTRLGHLCPSERDRRDKPGDDGWAAKLFAFFSGNRIQAIDSVMEK